MLVNFFTVWHCKSCRLRVPMNVYKDRKAKLRSAYSFMLNYSKITVCFRSRKKWLSSKWGKKKMANLSSFSLYSLPIPKGQVKGHQSYLWKEFKNGKRKFLKSNSVNCNAQWPDPVGLVIGHLSFAREENNGTKAALNWAWIIGSAFNGPHVKTTSKHNYIGDKYLHNLLSLIFASYVHKIT